MLLFLSLAWNPRAGFSGLQMVFSRYLLSIGLPFEQWLHFLAELSRSRDAARALPEGGVRGARPSCPGSTGGSWMTASESGEFGTPSEHTVDYAGREVSIRLYSRHRPSPSLVWHFNLLGQLVGQFYVAKQRELKLQQQTYVQALHETGARMTHDVKNLLQSLNVLCSAAERDPDGDPARAPGADASPPADRAAAAAADARQAAAAADRQRPVRARRRVVGVAAEDLSAARRGVRGDARSTPGILLPKDLFDSAAENLLQNALEKRKLDPGRRGSRVALELRRRRSSLRVCDTGRPVARNVLQGLLRGPVPSDTGYGIGLYQVARQAEMLGVHASGSPATSRARSCFELRGAAARRGRARPARRRRAQRPGTAAT